MGACEWLYGQRSRSNPASDPGSLQRPRVDKFQTPNRQSGPERNPDFVRPWRVQPSIDRTDAVLDRQCIRSRRPRRTRRGRNRPQERRSRWGSSHHPGTRQAPSAYGVAGALALEAVRRSPGTPGAGPVGGWRDGLAGRGRRHSRRVVEPSPLERAGGCPPTSRLTVSHFDHRWSRHENEGEPITGDYRYPPTSIVRRRSPSASRSLRRHYPEAGSCGQRAVERRLSPLPELPRVRADAT
jgi:hypothetical protein